MRDCRLVAVYVLNESCCDEGKLQCGSAARVDAQDGTHAGVNICQQFSVVRCGWSDKLEHAHDGAATNTSNVARSCSQCRVRRERTQTKATSVLRALTDTTHTALTAVWLHAAAQRAHRWTAAACPHASRSAFASGWSRARATRVDQRLS